MRGTTAHGFRPWSGWGRWSWQGGAVPANRAVALAQKAVAAEPEAGSYWLTLGVAHYRSGQWQDALTVLEKSMRLSDGGESTCWFFVAMTYAKLDKKELARQWYAKAIEMTERNGDCRIDSTNCLIRDEARVTLERAAK